MTTGDIKRTGGAERRSGDRRVGAAIARRRRGAAILSTLILTGCAATTGNTATGQADGSAQGIAPLASQSPNAAPGTPHYDPAKTYTEIADRNGGLQLYRNNRGTLAGRALPLGAAVQVDCLAPNASGMPSAEPGFYKLELAENGVAVTYFGISNGFANGDPVGNPNYQTPVDPAVPQCPPGTY